MVFDSIVALLCFYIHFNKASLFWLWWPVVLWHLLTHLPAAHNPALLIKSQDLVGTQPTSLVVTTGLIVVSGVRWHLGKSGGEAEAEAAGGAVCAAAGHRGRG